VKRLRRATVALPLLVATAILSRPAASQERPWVLEGLVVTASPTPRPLSDLATHVTVLRGDELRARGLVRVQDALRQVPGLTVVQGGGMGAATSLFLRGGESDYVLVLVDGVQVNQPGGAFDFSSLTLDNVERIEIVRGPGSALYGSDAMSGVVQIITRDGRGPVTASLETRMGSFGRRDWSLDASGGGDRSGWSVGLARIHSDGILPINNMYTNTAVSGAFRLTPDDHTTVRFAGRVGRHDYHFPTDGAGHVVDRNAFTFGDESTLSLTAARSLRSGADVQATLASYGFDGGSDDAADGPADTLGTFASSSLDQLRRDAVDVRGNLRVGGAVATLGWELAREGERSFTESASEFGPAADRSDNDRWNRGYYTHVTGTGEWLSFDGGARLEDNERFGRLWTWQTGGVARPAGQGGPALRASVGAGIKEPTFYENFATGFARGNPDLAPERSRSWEVGLDQSAAGGRVLLRATWFQQAFRNLIQYTFTTPTPGSPNFFNVARARARGVELSAEGAAGPLRGSASWTWLDTRVVDPGVDQGEGDEFAPGRELLRRPRRSGSMEVGARVAGGVSLSGSLGVVGPRADRDFTSYPAARVTLPRYALLSMGATWSLRRAGESLPALELSVRGENLLDESYQEVFGYAAPGRGVYVGLRASVGGGGGR
jgi:vitamin B12 transporter